MCSSDLGGLQAAPGEAGDGQMAWVTFQGAPGGTAGSSDLDLGPTVLSSPAIALGGEDATISYRCWFVCNDAGDPSQEDALRVEISTDEGGTWNVADEISASAAAWIDRSFVVSSVATPGETLTVRFVVEDRPNNSITEAGIDLVRVERTVCEDPSNPADLDGDGVVNGADLAVLLGAWGEKGGAADLNGDGVVGGADLSVLLGNWGG